MKRYLVMLLSAALLVAGTALDAQSGRRNRRTGGTDRQQNSRRAFDAGAWAKVQAEVKEKKPAEYKEIEALAKTNIAAAFMKLGETAKKANIETPRMAVPARSGQRGDQRGESSFALGRPEGMPGMRGNNSRKEVEAKLKAKYPEEYAQYEKNRSEAAAKIVALAKKESVKLPATADEISMLRAKFAKQLESAEAGGNRRDAMELFKGLAEKEGYAISFTGMGRGAGNNKALAVPSDAPQRETAAMKFRLLREKFPEEMKKYDSLRKSDKKAAQTLLKELSLRLKQTDDAEKK